MEQGGEINSLAVCAKPHSAHDDRLLIGERTSWIVLAIERRDLFTAMRTFLGIDAYIRYTIRAEHVYFSSNDTPAV